MKCAKAKRLISDYIDGNLDTGHVSSLEEHLDVCLDCQKFLKDFRKIAKDAKELNKLTPPNETWSKIEARLNTETQPVHVLAPGRRQWLNAPRLRFVLSAAFLLVILVGAGILGIHSLKQGGTLPGVDSKNIAFAKLEEAEHHYQLAIKALGEAVSYQEKSFDPEVAEVFRTNLEIINTSITACKQAVLSEPDNVETRNYLLAAYKDKADLLTEMIEVKDIYSHKRELETTL